MTKSVMVDANWCDRDNPIVHPLPHPIVRRNQELKGLSFALTMMLFLPELTGLAAEIHAENYRDFL